MNDTDPYLEVIAIFDSVNLPAAQREAILAWHHKQVASQVAAARDKTLKDIEFYFDGTEIGKVISAYAKQLKEPKK